MGLFCFGFEALCKNRRKKKKKKKKKKGSKEIRSHFGSFTPPTCMFAFIFLLLGALQTVCSLVRAL
jgi:hypothetical protein